MYLKTGFCALVLVLGSLELLARFSHWTTPRMTNKPFSSYILNGRLNRHNDLGNQSDLDRGQALRLGIFANSFAISPDSQEFLWPARLQKNLPNVHVENYSALGSRFFELQSLLNLAIENKERFDALYLILGLDIWPDKEVKLRIEDTFRYSKENRVCNLKSSCLWTRLKNIFLRQLEIDPILSGQFPSKVFQSVLANSASAYATQSKLKPIPQLIEEKSTCYAKHIVDCRKKFYNSFEQRSSNKYALTTNEKYDLYKNVFLSCQAQVDQRCTIVRVRKSPKSLAEEDIKSVLNQIKELFVLAKKLSPKILFTISPFSTSPTMDPRNIISINQVQINSLSGEDPTFFYDLDYAAEVRKATVATQRALSDLSEPVLDLQEIFDSHMESKVMIYNMGHATMEGNALAAKLFTENFNQMLHRDDSSTQGTN